MWVSYVGSVGHYWELTREASYVDAGRHLLSNTSFT